jgi:hypothetical protein
MYECNIILTRQNNKKYREMKMPVRPEKVVEIKAVWESPKFKTNAQRLIHPLRHCKKIEYGYTIREFAHAIFPEKMVADPKEDGGWGHYYALKNIHHMFRRFRKDIQNHEIVLFAGLVKGTGNWYYYNMINDEEGWKEVKLREAKIALGYDRALARIEEISKMSDEDRELLEKRTTEEIMRNVAKRQEKKKAQRRSR